MTNTKKVVLAKLFGKQANTKLSKTRKLKLATIDDIDRLNSYVSTMDKAVQETYGKLYSEWTNLIGLSERLRNVYFDMENLIEDYYELEKEVLADADDIGNQARELGIDPSQIKGVQELLDNFANMEDNINQAIQRMPDIEAAFEAL
jgi:hypothetical protein